MELYPTKEEYHQRVSFSNMSLEDRADILSAQCLAEALYYGKLRRDKQPVVRHSRALALKAKELNLSPYAQILGWIHDLVEDCNITYEEVGSFFTEKNRSRILFGLDALTRRDDEPVEVYFERIVDASEIDWEIGVVKLIDRWHFHHCPYGGTREKEIAKAIETLTVFREMCRGCWGTVQKQFITTFDDLVEEVMALAQNKLIELGVELA